MDHEHAAEALDAVAAFTLEAPGLAARIRDIESAMAGIEATEAAAFADEVGATHDLLDGSLIVKGLAGQINVIIHAAGILRALPFILAPGERVLSASLGAGNTGRAWDLETDRQIAEFKFITWQGGPESIRQNGLFIDVFHLAEADTDRRRVMYLTGATIPRRFLTTSSRAIRSVLSKNAQVASEFTGRYGDRYPTVRDYWHEVGHRVEVIDLAEVMPWPSGLVGA